MVAGGTGGHIYPALALARELVDKGVQVLWVGRPDGQEREIALQTGFEFYTIMASGFFSKRVLGKVVSIIRLLGGFSQSWRLLNRLQPDGIIAAGGFVSAAVVLAAWVQGRRFFLLEQNRIPGRVVRFFAPYAVESFLTFPPEVSFPGRYSVTGSPLRADIVVTRRADDGKTVLVLGGSQGARALNLAALDMAAALTNLRFIILTGKRDYQMIRALVRSANCELVESTAHPEELYRQATIAVSRAGGMVLSELLALGIPSILVPFPYAVDRHQEVNARYVASMGAALVLEENRLSGLVSLVRTLMADESKRREMERNARALAKPYAGRDIAERIGQCLAD